MSGEVTGPIQPEILLVPLNTGAVAYGRVVVFGQLQQRLLSGLPSLHNRPFFRGSGGGDGGGRGGRMHLLEMLFQCDFAGAELPAEMTDEDGGLLLVGRLHMKPELFLLVELSRALLLLTAENS